MLYIQYLNFSSRENSLNSHIKVYSFCHVTPQLSCMVHFVLFCFLYLSIYMISYAILPISQRTRQKNEILTTHNFEIFAATSKILYDLVYENMVKSSP